jgi:hypothetical protein
MQIVPRLARPAAVAALAVAALAIPATSASAQPSQDCLQARVATGNTLMSDAIELAGQGNWQAYGMAVQYASWAYTAALTCPQVRTA